MPRGGVRSGAGRKPNPKPNPNRPRPVAIRAATKVTVPAEPIQHQGLDPQALASMLPAIQEISERYARNQSTSLPRTRTNNPFKLPWFPSGAIPKEGPKLAMDELPAFNNAATEWLGGGAFAAEGLVFLGYSYLSELAQRPEYRTMAETIADDATRRWIDFDVVGDKKQQDQERAKDPIGYDERMADPDERKKRVAQSGKDDRVKAIKDDQERLEVRSRFYWASCYDSFMGRSHLYLQIGDANFEQVSGEMASSIGNSRDETSRTKVTKDTPLKSIQQVEPVWTYPQAYNAINPLAPDWYNPQKWYVMGREIDISRLQTFVSRPVPDILKPAYAFGGLPLTQLAKPYVDIWLQTRQSVADIIKSFSVMVLMTDLSTQTAPGNATNLLARVALFNMLRDNQGTFVVNKNTEDFKNVSAPLGGLHELQAQSQEHMLSVARIPAVKFTGIQPSGLNASSEGEIKVYDDTIEAYQKRALDANLTRIINFQMLSLWGDIDPLITHRWEQLRQLTDSEKAEQAKKEADRDDVYVGMGAISPAEVRAKIIADEDSPYAGLDPNDVPEPPAQPGEEGDGGEEEESENGNEGPSAAGGSEGGEAHDSSDPFGATDEFKEDEHPRGPDGKFGSGGGSTSSKSGASEMPDIPAFLKKSSGTSSKSGGGQKLKMPQFGLTPTPWESHQWKPERKRPAMTASIGEPEAAGSIVAMKPGDAPPIAKLNGVAFKKWNPPADWNKVKGQAKIDEPPMPKLPDGMGMSTGVVIREPDGRVWLMRPKNGFGGYDQTFPKGGLEPGLSPQANAIKEAYEETGLKVKITGFAGDFEGDTTVSRFYFAEREGGTPQDAGWEAEGVILAPADKLGGFLNRARDKAIAATLGPGETASKPELDPATLKKQGGKLGSNEGGTFTDDAGNKFYIKRPETKAHVANELAAARLYQLAGVNTLDYRPVKGGNHVATAWEKLDKNNISAFTPAERAEAAKDFAVHAWLSNWDAAGTGGDNQGIRGGKPTTLDVGGSLRYRAQGGPKGSAFGPKVTELDTMRDASKSPDAAKLFGKMTDSELRDSVARVASIPDDKIKAAVGDDAELAEILIKRKNDMAKRFDVPANDEALMLAADEANFEEGKHPRAPDGKFTSGGGGGSSGTEQLQAFIAGGGSKKEAIGKLLSKEAGTTIEEVLKVTGWPAVSMPQQAAALGMKLFKMKGGDGKTYYQGKPMTDAEKSALKQAAKEKKAGQQVDQQAQQILQNAGIIKPPEKTGLAAMAGQPAPKLQPPAPPPAPSFPAPTPAEKEKAKKSTTLKLEYVPGDKPIQNSGTAAAQKMLDAFNAKYAGKDGLSDAQLAQKVNDFKGVKAGIDAIVAKEKVHYVEIAKQAKAEQAAKAAELAAKAKADALAHAEKNKVLMDSLGIGPDQAEGLNALAKMLGQSNADLATAFKAYEDKANGFGYPISGIEAATIMSYSNGSYGKVNEALRSGKWTPAQHVYVSMVNKALSKMPKHAGNEHEGTHLIRNTHLTADQIAEYAEGHIIQEKALMSTSTKKPNGIFSGNVRFVITSKGKRGASIKKLSHYGSEDEVIFAAKTYFKVNKVEKLSQKLNTGADTVIHIEEWEDL